MTVLSAQTLRALRIIDPFCERTRLHGLTFGLSACGYDVRIAENISLVPGGFRLASTMERFDMPLDVMGIVHDKSTLARRGICVQNTVIEPGWRGHLTLEITNHFGLHQAIAEGTPIAQIIFHRLDAPTAQPYEGKYQDQAPGPQQAIIEEVVK